MRKLFVILFFSVITATAFAQKPKVEVKGDTIKINEVASFIMEDKSMGNQFLVKDLSGNLLISMMYQDYVDPAKVSNTNKSGKVVYIEVTFMGTGNIAEFAPVGMGKKFLAKQILDHDLMVDGKTNDVGESNFCKMYGRKFTAERNRLANPDVIIINRN
jgi:hypothetical protein